MSLPPLSCVYPFFSLNPSPQTSQDVTGFSQLRPLSPGLTEEFETAFGRQAAEINFLKTTLEKANEEIAKLKSINESLLNGEIQSPSSITELSLKTKYQLEKISEQSKEIDLLKHELAKATQEIANLKLASVTHKQKQDLEDIAKLRTSNSLLKTYNKKQREELLLLKTKIEDLNSKILSIFPHSTKKQTGEDSLNWGKRAKKSEDLCKNLASELSEPGPFIFASEETPGRASSFSSILPSLIQQGPKRKYRERQISAPSKLLRTSNAKNVHSLSCLSDLELVPQRATADVHLPIRALSPHSPLSFFDERVPSEEAERCRPSSFVSPMTSFLDDGYSSSRETLHSSTPSSLLSPMPSFSLQTPPSPLSLEDLFSLDRMDEQGIAQ